jgi:uncharacterized tellurite resistance protein B-like protein
MELNNIICELSNLLPQLSGFIDQFNSLVVSSGVNVFTDHAGNMSVDIPNSMTDVDASNVVKRLSIIDRLINTQGSAINDLLQAGMKIEKELKVSDPNYTSNLVQQIEEFKRLNSSYKH